FGASLSLALIGVGHLVGVTVGAAMIVGLLISYGVLLPTLTAGTPPGSGDISDAVSSTFGTEVRFVGAGAIAVAAVWTLLKILGPIVRGIPAAAPAPRGKSGGAPRARGRRRRAGGARPRSPPPAGPCRSASSVARSCSA